LVTYQELIRKTGFDTGYALLNRRFSDKL